MIFTNFRWQDAAGGHTGQSSGEMKAKFYGKNLREGCEMFDFTWPILYNYLHNCKGADKICIGQIK